jgi:hypothetical protein
MFHWRIAGIASDTPRSGAIAGLNGWCCPRLRIVSGTCLAPVPRVVSTLKTRNGIWSGDQAWSLEAYSGMHALWARPGAAIQLKYGPGNNGGLACRPYCVALESALPPAPDQHRARYQFFDSLPQPFEIKRRSSARSGFSSSPTKGVFTSATIISPASLFTLLNRPRSFIFWV